MGSTVASFAIWLTSNDPVALGTLLALNVLAFGLLLLAHEFGHAAVGLMRTQGLVIVRLGRSRTLWQRRFGRLRLELNAVPTLALARVHARLDRRSNALFLLAGPAGGSMAAALILLIGRRFQFSPLEVIGWVGLAVNLANLLPWKGSDGAQLLEALRTRHIARPTDPLVDVRARWLVLVTDPRPTFDRCSPEILADVLVLLGRARNDRSPEERTLIRLALAGWCWRRAEHGDTTPIRDRVLDARHRAALKGMPSDDTLVAAAAELAREEADLASGSPTADSLERGFEYGLTIEPPASLPEGQQRFAFRFGIAMHDVVTIAG